MMYRTSLVLLAALAACKKHDAAPAAAGSGSGSAVAAPVTAAPPPAARKAFTAMLEGKPVTFPTVRIQNGFQTADLVFSTGAGGCKNEYKTGDITLTVKMQPGPGGKYFAPGPMGVYADITSETQKLQASSVRSVLTLEPGEWKVGNKLEGALRFDDTAGYDATKVSYTASAPFEAEVCSLPTDEAYAAAPETVPAAPFTGTIGDQKFTFAGGVAEIQDQHLTVVTFYDTAVTCADYQKAKGVTVLLVGDIGANGKDTFLGTPQPRGISFRELDGTQVMVNGPTWVKFDAIEYKDGGDVKGSLYAASSPSSAKEYPKRAVKLAGTFAVKVCGN